MILNKRYWLVEYDWKENRPMCIKLEFETEEEAIEWSNKNTVDGKVLWYECIK